MYSDILTFLRMLAYIKLKEAVHNCSNFYVLTYPVYGLSVALEIHENGLYLENFFDYFTLRNTSFSSLLNASKCVLHDIPTEWNKTNGVECVFNVFFYFRLFFYFHIFFQEIEDTISVNTLH